ncbi:hypothetical protein H311_01750 [Anncaliia algerae PRA109]|nr:hypothetical protein H311_01750 [Anncaliia algerae PRA109]
MLYFKCKGHRCRYLENTTDALCIVESKDKITRAFFKILVNKKAETILPTICSQVVSVLRTYTDVHKSYSALFIK